MTQDKLPKHFKKIKIILLLLCTFFFLFLSVFLLVPKTVQAVEGIIPSPSICPKGAEPDDPRCNYSPCDFLKIFVSITRLILGSAGAITLILFLWAGLSFIVSAGNPEKITAQKKIITGASFGLLVILVSWTFVNLIIAILTGQSKAEVARIFPQATETSVARPWASVECPKIEQE